MGDRKVKPIDRLPTVLGSLLFVFFDIFSTIRYILLNVPIAIRGFVAPFMLLEKITTISLPPTGWIGV